MERNGISPSFDNRKGRNSISPHTTGNSMQSPKPVHKDPACNSDVQRIDLGGYGNFCKPVAGFRNGGAKAPAFRAEDEDRISFPVHFIQGHTRFRQRGPDPPDESGSTK